jgi:CheY-like chemotaxis protein
MSPYPRPAIVLIDHEPFILTLLQRMVGTLAPDYDLLLIRDGATALALVTRRPVALITTNYQQPRMDGVPLIAALRASAPACPIVLISGDLCRVPVPDGRFAGADFYLPKPIQFSQLAAVLQMALPQQAAVSGQSSRSVICSSGRLPCPRDTCDADGGEPHAMRLQEDEEPAHEARHPLGR